ncbi:MAG: glycosyltransferase [Pseudonocardia sp.]
MASGDGPRVAVLSLRDTRPVQDFGGLQEAEDALVEATSAGLYRVVVASPRFSRGSLAKPVVRSVLSASRVVRPFRVSHQQAGGEPADVLLVLARDLRDASVLVGLPGWFQLGAKVIVHVEVVTDRDLRRWADLVSHLRRRADALFTGCEMPPLGHLISGSGRLRTVGVIPPMLDVLAFPVRPDPVARNIDVFSPGPAPPLQHQLLRQWAVRHDGSYQQDIGQLGAVTSLAQHRRIFTAMATRSRLFLTNHRRYSQPGLGGRISRGGGAHHEVGTRFFEAMAAGCVLVGDLPEGSRVYGEYVAPARPLSLRLAADRLPDDVLAALDDAELSGSLGAVSRATALRRNDVAHRWRRMIELVGVPSSPGVDARIARLAELADLAERGQEPTSPHNAPTGNPTGNEPARWPSDGDPPGNEPARSPSGSSSG